MERKSLSRLQNSLPLTLYSFIFSFAASISPTAVDRKLPDRRKVRRTSIPICEEGLVQTDETALESFDALRVLERLLHEHHEIVRGDMNRFLSCTHQHRKQERETAHHEEVELAE